MLNQRLPEIGSIVHGRVSHYPYKVLDVWVVDFCEIQALCRVEYAGIDPRVRKSFPESYTLSLAELDLGPVEAQHA